jgi:GNAT superfamily N-acetyltransferase
MIERLPEGHAIGALEHRELGELAQWAADEGWNPCDSDLEVAWAHDAGGFVALRDGSELIGAGSVLRYGAGFGFMGLFIVRSDRRGVGLGRILWHHRRDLLLRRLAPGATIGMDGVVAMVPFYERGGFRVERFDVRFDGIARSGEASDGAELAERHLPMITELDREACGFDRAGLLGAWIRRGDARAVVSQTQDRVNGFAVLRRCRQGHRLGPVVAQDAVTAKRLIDDLTSGVAGRPIQIDVPSTNPAALDLARSLGWTESFRCARMYLGEPPRTRGELSFGTCSLEFG